MSDLISRQSAIDALYHHFPHMTREECAAILHEVGDVQPEIVRCKDCKYWHQFSSCSAFPEYHECGASGFAHIQTIAEEFCNRAERRQDAAD